MSLPQAELNAAGADPLDPIAAALFRPMGVAGVYARTAIYESVVEGLNRLISRERDPRAEVLRFPPVMSREQIEKSGYLKSFPNLLGCVCALHGSESAIRSAAESYEQGADWTQSLGASDLVLSPAACYPIYPLAASRGPVPSSGLLFDVAAECFRREPSRALNRLQSFRMREFVCIGMPQDIMLFRERWMAKAETLARELALPCTLDVASDPFFGRVGQIMAVSQRQQSLEIRAPDSLSPERRADRLHELQLPPRSLRRHLGARRQGRQRRAYQLCRLRHRPARRRPLLHSWR